MFSGNSAVPVMVTVPLTVVPLVSPGCGANLTLMVQELPAAKLAPHVPGAVVEREKSVPPLNVMLPMDNCGLPVGLLRVSDRWCFGSKRSPRIALARQGYI